MASPQSLWLASGRLATAPSSTMPPWVTSNARSELERRPAICRQSTVWLSAILLQAPPRTTACITPEKEFGQPISSIAEGGASPRASKVSSTSKPIAIAVSTARGSGLVTTKSYGPADFATRLARTIPGCERCAPGLRLIVCRRTSTVLIPNTIVHLGPSRLHDHLHPGISG
jgi:hypothetical protein